jgi:hypothetical protein
MNLGFTGTRKGLTVSQELTLDTLLMGWPSAVDFHHGDCIGADEQASFLAEVNGYRLICHPPAETQYRAFTEDNDEMREPKGYYARNRDIVDESDHLIACPEYGSPITEETKGGTAYTVKYARKRGKPITIVLPNGTVWVEE